MFVQGECSLDRSQGGLGVGLSLCKRLVEMHGGKITAASAGAHQGATFTVRLPLIAQPAEEARCDPQTVMPGCRPQLLSAGS
jgi:signal transduction histidine kinase